MKRHRKFSLSQRIAIFIAAMGLSCSGAMGAVGKLEPIPVPNILRLEPIPEAVNPEVPAVAGQFGSVAVTVGATQSTVTPAANGATAGSGAGLLTLQASIGRAFSSNAPDFLFGDEILPPAFDAKGLALIDQTPTEYWRAEPVRAGESVKYIDPDSGTVINVPVAEGEVERFHFSPHAGRTFASHSGRARVVWRSLLPIDEDNHFAILEQFYNVSSSTRLETRKIFWTEGRYTGPTVSIPEGIIQDLFIVHNNSVPKTVPEEEAVLEPPAAEAPVRVETLWFDETQSVLRAVNREGRVLVELLGSLNGSPGSGLREHIGIEVVELGQETRPIIVDTLIGEQILPKPDGVNVDPEESELTPLQVNALSLGVNYTERHTFEGQEVFYAVRENDEPLRVQFYWREKGLKDILWPTYLNGYRLVWPEDIDAFPAKFARPADPDLSGETFVALPRGNTPELVYQDDADGSEAALDFQSSLLVDLTDGLDSVNRSLLRFTSGNSFWYVRVYSSAEFLLGDRDRSGDIDIRQVARVGERIEPPAGVESDAGYIDSTYGTAYNVNAYINPFGEGGIENAETGAIIPVNNLPGNDQLRVWWFDKIDSPAESEGVFEPLYFPSKVAEYDIRAPSDFRSLVLASNEGSGELTTEEAEGSVYVQNDPTQHGYNPNEEHALLLSGRVYALRDDLNVVGVSSDPYVFLDHIDNDGRPSVSVFEVLRHSDEAQFDYTAVAGTLLQAPRPLNALPLPLLPNGQSANREVLASDGARDLSPNEQTSAEFPHYDRFVYEDRKGNKWIYRGLHDNGSTESPELQMQFFYKTEDGFAFPNDSSGVDQAPVVGTIVPYLRPYANGVDETDGFEGDPVSGTPLDIVYRPEWPESVPELRFGETLTLPKFGLPQIRGQSSVQVIYEGSLAQETAASGEVDSEVGPNIVKLFDPTRLKEYKFNPSGLDRLPDSIATTVSRGKIYFQNLPTHLQQRLFVDPNLGGDGSLVFFGEFVDEAAGEDYLLLNVLSPGELETVKALCESGDALKTKWDEAVTKLSTTLERFIEDPGTPGTYISEGSETFVTSELAELTSPPARPSVPGLGSLGFFDEAVDSYALTAVGGGEGYVVLLTGNGEAFTPEEEPVAVKIIRVGGGLYTGELKPIVASNPLSENVTVQHTSDFAAGANGFEFEWRKAPPVNGLSPPVYDFERRLIDTGSLEYALIREGLEPELVALPSELAINLSGSEPGMSLQAEIDIAESGPDTAEVSALYFGFRLSDAGAVRVSINGNSVLDTEIDLPLSSLPREVALIMGGESDPLVVYAVSASQFSVIGPDFLEFVYSSNEEDDVVSEIDIRIAGTYREDVSTQNYSLVSRDAGRNRYLVAGSGIDTLGDNYYIMRYRPLSGHVLYPNDGYVSDQEGWSEWTAPALVEGWIKRVLAGINPFNQRISDFYDNAIDTDVSLLTQAGTRWEGDIALTLDSVQDAGLIEIYETVLKRGISLSIDGTPEVDYGPANDALLLAAGYLADLYMALGDEAYADASNPTILFDSQAIGTVADSSVVADFEDVYRSTATARFAFQGQVSSLLEEELHLLRGRDDFLAPGIEISPAYNRLFWNYTRGIDAGEVIYALNYNITEKDGDEADGKIDAEDAQRQYPQGHGDAYGHYLTAVKNYYRLLRDAQFTWGTRSEAVNILGQPVSVDYLDERKFASAAAALARATRQIQTLERRKAHLDTSEGWTHLDQTRENSRTGRIRNWGFDDWSARGGQSAYLNWVTANAILPDEDTTNEGIQQIDRSTVPELNELAASGSEIQRRMDSADRRLNPLDLTADSLVFDISPQAQADGETHFEQIYNRAVRAMSNAFDVFERATDSSRLLRSQENQNQDLNAAVVDQERAFVSQLLEVYGAPYPGDIGPGKTYSQGYEGPDLFRYMYIDRPFEIFSKEQLFSYENDEQTFSLAVKDESLIESFNNPRIYFNFKEDAGDSEKVDYTIQDDLGPYFFPSNNSGKRSQIGTLQSALAEVRLAEEQMYSSLNSMDNDRESFINALSNFEKDVRNRYLIMTANRTLDVTKKIWEEYKAASKALREGFERTKKAQENIANTIKEGIPTVVGTANDATFAARAAILASKVAALYAVEAADIAAAKTERLGDRFILAAEFTNKLFLLGIEDDNYIRSQTKSLNDQYKVALARIQEVDSAYVKYTRTLERFRNELSKGESILAQRETYRKRAAAVIQGYRTRDVAFRSFRTEALEQYQNLFDWAAKYAFLAAQAYDYETGLLGSDQGREFLGGIAATRALGLLNEAGEPTFAASELGDPGLSGFLARMSADWEVVKGRLGFNNPDVYGTTFSLRKELLRFPSGPSGDRQWRELLSQLVIPNLLTHANVAAHALQIDSSGGTPVPGIVVEFPTEIATGLNFFGKPLAAGDHRFTESNFATKIHSVGVVFEDYEGMDPCLLCANNVPGHTIDDHGPNALSATPHVYLIPGGLDTMRTPPLGDSETLRQWKVLDHALPLPYDIGSIELSGGDAGFFTVGSRSLGEDFLAARRHQAFRAVDNAAFFVSNRSDEYTNSRLVGRSAVNSNWILVIPAIELLNDPEEGLRRFIETVSDIKIHLRTYSYSGN